MKAFIANTHSVMNSGDAGIVLAQIRFLRKLCPSLEISLSSRTPRLDKKIYSDLDVKLLPPLIPAPSVYSGAVEKIRKCLKNLFAIRSKAAFLREIKGSDLVISSGGGYFWSHRKFLPGPMFLQNYLHLMPAVQRKKPVFFFPQSFDPLRSRAAVRLLKNLLKEASVVRIYAREQPSFRYLERILEKTERVRICPDMAFLLDPPGRSTPEHPHLWSSLKRPVVAMTLRQWDFPETRDARSKTTKRDTYMENMREICRSVWKKWDGSVVLFCQSRGPGPFEDDRLITGFLAESLRHRIPAENFRFVDLPETAHPHDILDLLSRADLLIATRFHSAIFALITGTPVISIAYQKKSTGILKALGLERFNIPISDFDAERILGLGREILDHNEEIRSGIRRKVREMRERIEDELASTVRPFLSQESHEDSAGQ